VEAKKFKKNIEILLAGGIRTGEEDRKKYNKTNKLQSFD